MNKLPQPIHDDEETIEQLVKTNFSTFKPEFALILEAYRRYQKVKGHALKVSAITISPLLQKKIKGLYQSKRDCLSYIKSIRNAEETYSCPMCGSADVGTLDHIFPQKKFPEYSIFSRNIVPACSGCNTKRGNKFSDPHGGRILHPYYDEFLAQRLVYTRLIAEKDYERPSLQIALVNSKHVNRAEINFHIQSVMSKTRILTKQIQTWNKLKTRPQNILRFDTDSITEVALKRALELTIDISDDKFQSKNNWDSMLFYGIKTNSDCMKFLINYWKNSDLDFI